jgi:phosphoglycolate phosphatase-like HAD superfamily hydrolase
MKFTKLIKQSIVRAIIQDIPPIDKEARALAINAAIVKAMSPEVRKLFKTHPTALRTQSVAYTNPFRHWGNDVTVGDVTDEKIKEIIKPYETQEEARAQAENKLRHAFEGINTLKQALTTFPEFKKYYPTEAEPTKNLPALANVMADLSKLGWPKK